MWRLRRMLPGFWGCLLIAIIVVPAAAWKFGFVDPSSLKRMFSDMTSGQSWQGQPSPQKRSKQVNVDPRENDEKSKSWLPDWFKKSPDTDRDNQDPDDWAPKQPKNKQYDRRAPGPSEHERWHRGGCVFKGDC